MVVISQIVGILNITPDSFSDGGKFLDSNAAISRAEALSNEGADIIELSAQSSNINATQIPDALEWERIFPVLQYCKSKNLKISVDTYKPFVIRKCLENRVDVINNINSFRDELSRNTLKDFSNSLPDLILMFSQNNGDFAEGNSNLNVENVMDAIIVFFERKFEELKKIGIPESKIIVDPGMGLFLSPDPTVSIHVLKNISVLKEKFPRVMVSVSRKSFIGALCDNVKPPERSGGTLACEKFLADRGIDFIRTHDPLQLKQFIRMNLLLIGE